MLFFFQALDLASDWLKKIESDFGVFPLPWRERYQFRYSCHCLTTNTVGFAKLKGHLWILSAFFYHSKNRKGLLNIISIVRFLKNKMKLHSFGQVSPQCFSVYTFFIPSVLLQCFYLDLIDSNFIKSSKSD